MTKYVSFTSSGKVLQYGNLEISLAEIRLIKEKNGVTAFGITDNQYKELASGADASESGGVVTIGEPVHGLPHYKGEVERLQKLTNKRLFINYRDDIDNSDANISTYKTNLKNYFISDVKVPINAAANKAEVDAAVAAIDWSSVVIP
tara:strand:+ start:492 stop:932 length:441 start_codon:yes stop_codon:yes gene_type:complete